MTDYQLNLAVMSLKQGDLSMIDPIIEHHLRLIDRVAVIRARAFPYKYQDIKSASRFGAVQACHWAAEGRMYDNRITPWIVYNCNRFITEFVNEDHMIQIPRKEFKNRVALNENNIFRYYSVSTLQHDFEEFAALAQQEDLGFEDQCSKNETSEQYYDMFRELDLNETEWKIVELRVMGHTLEEVAQNLAMSYSAVHRAIKRVQKRAVIAFSLRRFVHEAISGTDGEGTDSDGGIQVPSSDSDEQDTEGDSSCPRQLDSGTGKSDCDHHGHPVEDRPIDGGAKGKQQIDDVGGNR